MDLRGRRKENFNLITSAAAEAALIKKRWEFPKPPSWRKLKGDFSICNHCSILAHTQRPLTHIHVSHVDETLRMGLCCADVVGDNENLLSFPFAGSG